MTADRRRTHRGSPDLSDLPPHAEIITKDGDLSEHAPAGGPTWTVPAS
jgi:hypothetical protein